MSKQVIIFEPNTLKEGVARIADSSMYREIGTDQYVDEPGFGWPLGLFINLARGADLTPGKIHPDEFRKFVSILPQSFKDALADCYDTYGPGESDVDMADNYPEAYEDLKEAFTGNLIVLAGRAPQDGVFYLVNLNELLANVLNP